MKRALAKHYERTALLPCMVPGCHQPVELHHINGGISLKTRQPLPRRKNQAEAIVVPLCDEHHRTGKLSIHNLGQSMFEETHGMPQGFTIAYAATLLADTLLNG